MQLFEVLDKQGVRDFIMANVLINQHLKNYIRPLDKDVNDVFDKTKNKAFRHGEATRWVLKSDEGKIIGRIAAYANKKYKTKGDEVPVGGIGFFDCINDQEAADMLFDVAKHWLSQKGFEAMDGPINFGERDRWWGLIIDGFDPPVYCMNFNAPYYEVLFENYGFKTFFNQYCYSLRVKDKLQPKFYERHERLSADPNYKAMHIRKDQLPKFAQDFSTIYNKAWAGHGGLKTLSKEVVLKMFQQMKPIMDERVVWFTYYKEEPIALWVNLPDLNQWFKYLQGRFDWLGKLKFLWVKSTRRCSKFTGLAFGIVPEFQGKGVDSYMIMEGAKIIQVQMLYDDYEMQWIGDFNPKMINIALSLGTHQSRHLKTFRYMFDPMREVKPHPVYV